MSEPPPDAPDALPSPDSTPPVIADELVIHGLLQYLLRRDEAARARRIDGALRAIADSESAPRRRLRFPVATRLLISAAALITMVAAVVLVATMSEPSALAEVRRAIDAHRAPDGRDRRYEVRVLSWQDDKPRAEPHAIMDTRSPGFVLVRHRPPGSKGFVIVGRDAQGMWALLDDGSVERDRPRRSWPPWSVDDKNLLVDSIDRILEHLQTGFRLERTTGVALDSDPLRTFDCVSAERIDRAGPMPNDVKVWIDPATRLVRRVAFAWDPSDAPRPAGRPPSPKMIILERTADPTLPTDWFTPEAHKKH